MIHTESNGENSQVVAAPQRRKVKSQNGSKKSKRSLRRRMQSILTSPVHLFRRYVLRKRPKKFSSKEDESNDFQNFEGAEAVETAKQRNLPCYLLFLGLQQSGKSTTISKLFNEKRPTPKTSSLDPSIKIFKNTSVGHEIGLKVVDTPGFCANEQQDAELLTALSSFLKRDLPHRIPTVTFIVARIDDDDDDGKLCGAEESQFCRMLKTLSQAENIITDQLYSNIVLLLTHSQKTNDVPARISKFQHEFAKVFPVTTPIPAIAIDNIRYNNKSRQECNSKKVEDKFKSYHDIIFGGLKDFAGKKQEHSLSSLMFWFTGKAKRFSVPFKQEILPLETLTECTARLEEVTEKPSDSEPYFVMHHLESVKRRKSQRKDKGLTQQQQLQTCISPGSQIMLADKSLISIEKCLVGDKVLGLHGACSVITGIKKVHVDEIATEGKSIGNIYCSAIPNESSEEEKNSSKFIHMYSNGMFELVDASKANVPEKTSAESLYILELDSPTGTFVMNSFPCFAKSFNGNGSV